MGIRCKRRWKFLGLFLFSFFLLQAGVVASSKEAEYPSKPITFYISFGAGGTDTFMRVLLESASKHLGQPFIPVNKPGAGGTITSMAIMNAKPDGYTLGMLVASSAFVAPHSGEISYKDLSGFTLVANVGTYVYPLMVRAEEPWKTWKEFVEWARKSPRAAKIGITGARPVSAQGIVLWQVEKKEQVEFTYITMKGSSEILNSTLGGHINVFGGTIDATSMQYIKEGKLRILTYLGPDKVPGYEGIPSLQELYGFSISSLVGIAGPKGLPETVVRKLEDAFARAVKDPDFLTVMNRLLTPVNYMDRGRIQKYVEEAFLRTGEVMKMMKAEEGQGKK